MNLAAALLLALPAPAGGIAAGIEWRPNWDAALEEAAETNRVVLVAVNMDGERANDRMAKTVYRDKAVARLAGGTINVVASVFEHAGEGRTCPRFGSIECADHRRVEAAVREDVLAPDADGSIVAPQHVLLAPSGEVILSVPFEITAGELEWCLARAMGEVDPTLAPKLSSKARAPRRLVLGEVSQEDAGSNLGREEALALIAELKKGSRGREVIQAVRRLVTADEPEAREYVQLLMRGNVAGRRLRGGSREDRSDDELRAQILRAIGERSAPSWWEIPADFATSSNPQLREEAAVALEQLAAPEALEDVRAALSKEDDERIAACWLRALASVGSTDDRTRKAILKEAAKTKSDEHRRLNAIVALGHLAENADVAAALARMVTDAGQRTAAAAACAIGLGRHEGLAGAVRAALAELPEGSPAKASFEAALAVLERGDLGPLQGPIGELCGDRIPRDRIFGGVKKPGKRAE